MKTPSTLTDFNGLEPGLCPSVTDMVEAMNSLIQERHNQNENCVTVEVSRGTQKIEIHLANERSGSAFFRTDLEHFFFSNEFGVMLKGKGPHKPELAHGIVRIHYPMIYTDLIEYNIVGDRKVSLLLLSFHFRAQSWRHYNCWTVREL